jgi:hypothetical protein
MHSPDSLTLDYGIPEIEKLLGYEIAIKMFTENPRQIVLGGDFYRETPKRPDTTRKSLRDIIFGRR